MEPRRDRASARWFLHAQGNTLGPYDDDQVLSALKEGEILPSDKIFSAQDKTWTILSSHPYFKTRGELLTFRRANQLSAPPSPRKLRTKNVTPPPIPVLPPKPAHELAREAEVFPEPAPIIAAAPEPTSSSAPETEAPKITRAPKAPRVPKLAPEILSLAPEPAPRMHDPVVTHVALLPEPESVPQHASAPAVPATPPPEEMGLLETVVLGPRDVVHVEPLVLEDSVMAQALRKSAARAPGPARGAELLPRAPEEIAEEENLEDMARALERALEEQPALASEPSPIVDSQIPSRPEIKPVFLTDPGSWARAPEPPPKASRVIQIQLNMPEKLWAKALLFLFVATLAAGGGYLLSAKDKTRDQKGFRLSDPSSPYAVPIEAVDPNPPLKAPTRPQRE